MKIDEFIKKVNDRDGMGAEEVHKLIVFGPEHHRPIYQMPFDATNFIEIDTWATSNSLYWKKPDREYLSALIEEFLHTPIKERFPEKKYRLRWIDDNDDYGFANYFDCYHGKWSLVFKEDAKQYTQQGLDELKKINPHLAPAIDAMKELVEED
ncbi:hypothetical protein [Limosilactobacillus vaginalis]|uniref:hypothetical protein n=1 Tax=Limosilactobacillus vaginalis TaxID=1633 RepID=UPI001F095CED|nr:hypothetical protein [Limosilactobacillus vaginalis]